ncbi:MAG: hypothetical protein KAR83_09360 [Thermodesulfovibrionales bacterium]|nr:hypothetical protein [Thermodesulfovibrionales bacterium]
MYAKDHGEALAGLLHNYCGDSIEIQFTDDLAVWCKANGIKARDDHDIMRIVDRGGGAVRLGILEVIPEGLVDERIKALSVRWSLQNVANNLADRLDTDKKKLAYLLLKEYSTTVSELDDELVADNWVFAELRKYGFFKE